MGIAHSKQASQQKSSGRLRKRSRLSGSFRRSFTTHKQQPSPPPSPNTTSLPSIPSPTSSTHQQQQQQEYQHDDLATIISLHDTPPLDHHQLNRHVLEEEAENEHDDELLPLTPPRKMRIIGSSNNDNNNNNNNSNNDNSSNITNITSNGPTIRRNKRKSTSRPVSTLSCSTDSGLQSVTSSGWTFSGGLFSHIDTNTSSNITAITDFSTISKRSMLDWPDDYATDRKRTLPPPYCQQRHSLQGESSCAARTTTTTTATTTTSSSLANPAATMTTSEQLALQGFEDAQNTISTGATSVKLDNEKNSDTEVVRDSSPASKTCLLLNTLLTSLARSPASSFRLLMDAMTAAKSQEQQTDEDGQPVQEIIFKAAEIWYQQTDDSAAQAWIARCTIEGWGIEADPKLGFTRLKALADHGSWEAFYPLAYYYLHGIDTVQPVDPVAAYQWFLATVEAQVPHYSLKQDQQAASAIIALAQYRLGFILFHGLGMAEQPEQALGWFEKSAILGNRYSQFIMGFHYEKGIIVGQNIIKAREYYQLSANQGFVDSQAALGICLIEHDEIKQGVHWLEQAILLNNTRAMLKYGIMHETGHGVPKDGEKAIYYYKLAANQDDPVAHYILGLHYRLGQGLLQQNYQLAGKHLTRSARAGFAPSQRLIGLMYMQGLISPQSEHDQQLRKDEKTALVWFRRAASHGDVRALGLVGSCYEHGHGAAVNYDIALQYYQKAARISSPFHCAAQVAVATLLHRMNRHRDALDWFLRASSSPCCDTSAGNEKDDSIALAAFDQAHRTALLMIARYRLHGWAGTRDPETAFDLLCQLTANDTKDGHAHYWLAACYEEGILDICDRDLVKAFHHYHVAALTGDSDAQFQVAFMLSNGKGVEKNRLDAFHWYEKAANQGHKTALYSLGLYYVKGLDGIDKDLKKAAECFEKSAQLGLVTAMTSLASLLRIQLTQMTSSDQSEDATASYYREQTIYWYNKAASSGDVNAQRELGILYNSGILGITQDHTKALNFLGKASQQQDAQATLLLASYYQHGIVVDKDDDHAIRLYIHAASLGSSVAHFAAAQLLHALHRYEQAFEQYQRASNDPQLQRTRIGRTARLMEARYILSYIASSPSSLSNSTTDLTSRHTKQRAFKTLETLAVIDRFDASFYWLADCYFTGNGTSVNYHDALHWFRRSADETDDKESMFKAAQMYEKGLGSDVNLSLALHYNRKAAISGHVEAQHQMGMAYWRGLYGLDINLSESIHWFTKSATQRFSDSHWALGQLSIENGDQEMAIAWWQKAVDLGHVLAMRLLAMLYLQPPPSSIPSSSSCASNVMDLGQALHLLADASRLGDTESLVLLGQVHQAGMVTSFQRSISPTSTLLMDDQQLNSSSSDYSFNGKGTSIVNSDGEEELVIDEEETQHLQRQQEEQELAIRCFEQAASMGHVGAMFLAGQSWHTQQQYAAAFEYYNQAAQLGHTLSKIMRARYRLGGLGGIPISKEEGFSELLECAENENCAEAFNSIGQCYEMGFGTQKDVNLAYKWYLRSAEATNDAEAMYRIAQLYNDELLDTHGETKEYAACRWFHLADDTNGHVRANYQLGIYYCYGVHQRSSATVTPINQALAMKHFRKAALQDDKDAMYELGQFYLAGHGEKALSVDSQSEGIHWLTRAAQQGSKQAQYELATIYHSGRDQTQPDGTVATIAEQDFEKAYNLFCQAARQGDITATIYIGTYYEHGIHVAPSIDLAKEWYQEAIELASQTSTPISEKLWLAEFGLARLLHQEKPSLEAYTLFCAAHQHGPSVSSSSLVIDSPAATLTCVSGFYSATTLCSVMIARYQLYGWGGVTKNCTMAAHRLLALAETGHAKVFLDVAQCYEEGIGLCQDYVKAYTWYGRIIAQANMMSALDQGKDEDDAGDDLWDEEDEHDYATALYKLAEFYRCGYTPNGQVDHEKATSLYYLAADKGSLEARHHVQSSLM